MIEVSELTKYYGDRKGVGPLSFSIETGEIVGLLGLNGAGKTTTLRMLSSDLLPTSGRILIDGVDLTEAPEKVRPRIGYLPERPPLYEEMSIREYLAFALQLRGKTGHDAARRIDEVMGLTNLDGEASTRISQLSHGFRQRVGIAQAVVHEPALLLLDEPIKGLDPVQIVEMRSLVRSLRGRHTIIISSHILSEISETCDRLLVIDRGELIASGSEQELAGSLAAGHGVTVTVRLPADWRAEDEGQAASALLDLVRGVAGVQEVTLVPPAEAGEGVVSVQIRAERDLRERLCVELVEAGIGLLGLGSAARELESLFLELTGTAAGRAAGSSEGTKRAATVEGGVEEEA